MTKQEPVKYSRGQLVLIWFSVCVLAGIGLWLLASNVVMIFQPWPQESREGAMLLTTDLLLQHRNIYSFDVAPEYTNVYGFVYSWCVYPAAAVFGSNFAVHRAFSQFWMLLTCVIFLMILRRLRVPWMLAIIAALILWRELGAGLGILARPDSLGNLLYLLGLAVAWRFGFSTLAMAATLVLGILAFYTKLYFFLVIPFVCGYVFLFRSKRAGIAWGVGALALVGVSLWLVNRVYPAYVPAAIYNVFLQAPGARSISHLKVQLIGYTALHSGLFLIIGVMLLQALWQRALRLPPWPWLNLTQFNRPMLTFDCEFWAWASFCALLVLCVSLGQHGGNLMLYFHQLLSPVLLIPIFVFLARLQFRTWVSALIAVNACVLLLRIKPFPHDASAQWKEWEKLVAQHQNVLAAPILSDVLRRQNRTIYDSGYPEYILQSSLNKPQWSPQMTAQTRRLLETIHEGLAQRRFDLVVSIQPDWPLVPRELLEQNYQKLKEAKLPMHWAGGGPMGEIWAPKSPAPATSVTATTAP